MNLLDLANDPRAQLVLGLVVASASSTAHTFLDKHPRTQAFLRLASHTLGPLNLPAMKAAGIALCRAVVAYEDKAAKPLLTITGPVGAPSDGVKAWPQS